MLGPPWMLFRYASVSFLPPKHIIRMVIHQNICLENALFNYQSIFWMFPRAEHFITDSSRTCAQRTSRDPVLSLRYACFSLNNKQHNFQTNSPPRNNSCLMEQDRKQFLHFSWNIEKRKEKIKESCLHAGKYNASLIENNLLTGDATRALIVSWPCLLLFPGMPPHALWHKQIQIRMLSLHDLPFWQPIIVQFICTQPFFVEKSLCVPHTGVATAIKGIEQNVLWLKNTSNQIAFYLHLLWFCVVSFCLFSSPLQDPRDLRCRDFYVSL